VGGTSYHESSASAAGGFNGGKLNGLTQWTALLSAAISNSQSSDRI